MNFGKFDMVLLTTMSLAVVIMSFTFPALGLTDQSDEVGEDDIPEFNLSASQFDIVGDFPDTPGTPNSGTMVYDEQRGNSIPSETLFWIDRPKEDGQSIEVQNRTSDFRILVQNWSSDGTTPPVIAEDEYIINAGDEGRVIDHNNDSWYITFEVTELENYRQPNMTAEIEWEIQESPSDEAGGISAIPIIGGVFDTVDFVAGMLAYLGDIIFWFVGTLFEIALSLIAILLNIMTFSVELMVWLITTYESIVSGAPDPFSTTILLIPALMLFYEFMKIGMLGIKLLPTT